MHMLISCPLCKKSGEQEIEFAWHHFLHFICKWCKKYFVVREEEKNSET